MPNGGRPYDFDIHSVYVEYISVGPPTGQRQVRITVEDPAGETVAITGGDTQPVNTTRHYMAFFQAPVDRVTNGDDIQWCPWPGTMVVEPGSRIRVKNVAPAAGVNDTVRLRVQYDNTMGNRASD